MKTGDCQLHVAATLLMASTVLGACAGDNAKPAFAEAPAAAARTAELVEQIGVEPGPVQHTEGPAAVLAEAAGQVEVRRLGEDSFGPIKKDAPLYQGDQVRAGDNAHATVLFSDESTAEVAEISTLGIGSRVATADPASSAAVLSGIARFSVSPRAPGEGPFLVFTSAGIVATKGTVFGVGVAANGNARVGVESGAVDVAGGAAFDTPVPLDASQTVDLTAAGIVAPPAPWATDDWGVWRDRADADIQVADTAAFHADAMASLASELKNTYGTLESLDAQVADFESEAAANADANLSASYEASLPAASIAIDASFLTALRLEYLTQAYLSHAVLAGDLYVRHPDVVEWKPLEPQVQAAVLWPKRFDATAVAYFEPLRVQYYLHHPRGRAHAQWVGVSVPTFYASVTPPEVPAVELKSKLRFRPFMPPTVRFTASARPIWIAEPDTGWHAKVKLRTAPPRGAVVFWARPPKLHGHVMLGATVRHDLPVLFAVHPPAARGRLKAHYKMGVSHKIKLSPPDWRGAAQSRANWKADWDSPGIKARAPKAHGRVDAAFGAKLDAHGKPHAVRIQAPPAPRFSATFKVKGPAFKPPKPPKLKAEAKASVSFKHGH